MSAVIECVPNFSEGRSRRVIESLRAEIESVTGVHVLDVHSDAAHHRSVFTFAGSVLAVLEAAFRSVRVAGTLIDLTHHRGVHPRIGAADVVPLVPLSGLTLSEAANAARVLGRRIGDTLDVPVFLYGHQTRRTLPEIRRGGWRTLGERMRTLPEWQPDFGPAAPHPTAGVTAVGARPILVAYNVVLDSPTAEPAKIIARTIRSSNGGLPSVRALGFLVDGRAQVSMNLLDIDTTPPLAVFEAVSRQAEALGVAVLGSEIVGLVPERAIPPDAEGSLALRHGVEPHLLEPRLRASLPAWSA